MDEITESLLKRSIRMKHYQQYQDHIDSLDKAENMFATESSQTGKLSGKTVKLIQGANTSTEKIFKHFKNEHPEL